MPTLVPPCDPNALLTRMELPPPPQMPPPPRISVSPNMDAPLVRGRLKGTPGLALGPRGAHRGLSRAQRREAGGNHRPRKKATGGGRF